MLDKIINEKIIGSLIRPGEMRVIAEIQKAIDKKEYHG